jgi:DNA-binding beta-propeller fold protein YncE
MTNNKSIRVFTSLAILGLVSASASLAKDIPLIAPDKLSDVGELSVPSDVEIGKDGKIYVVDGGNHQVAVFDAAGSRIGTLGEMGSEEGQFTSPLGLGTSKKGEVYVADKGNNRLVMFDAKGKFRRAIPLAEDGDDVVPVDVAVGLKGKELFVTANNSHKVLVFSTKGELLRAWGGEGEDDGQFRYPATIDIDAAGNVYVVDVLNARVQKFDPAGTHMLTIGKLGGKAGTFFRPKGVAVDASGNIYVSDSFLGVVQVFDPAGESLYVIGEDGTATVFKTPVGMTAIDTRLYVTQMLAGNVLVLEPQAPAPAAPEEEAAE